MNQTEFGILLMLLERHIKDNNLCEECYVKAKNDKILVHKLGFLNTKNVIDIFKDKIRLQQLNIQNHNLVGIDKAWNNLLSHTESQIFQFVITTSEAGYLIILSADLSKLVGIVKQPNINLKTDFEQQLILKNAGHPNHDLSLFDKGILVN